MSVKSHAIMAGVAAGVAMIAGVAIGGGLANTSTQKPEPEVVVETVYEERVVTETETVEVETPVWTAECQDYVERADKIVEASKALAGSSGQQKILLDSAAVNINLGDQPQLALIGRDMNDLKEEMTGHYEVIAQWRVDIDVIASACQTSVDG